MRTTLQLFVVCIALLTAPMAAQQQERVVSGPPPEIRTLVEAFSSAVLGSSAEAWEGMAKQHFAADYLKKQTPADRKKLYDKLHADFAGAKRGPVRREGPDAPLQVEMVKPSGPVGTITLSISDANPPRITDISTQKAGQ